MIYDRNAFYDLINKSIFPDHEKKTAHNYSAVVVYLSRVYIFSYQNKDIKNKNVCTDEAKKITFCAQY